VELVAAEVGDELHLDRKPETIRSRKLFDLPDGETVFPTPELRARGAAATAPGQRWLRPIPQPEGRSSPLTSGTSAIRGIRATLGVPGTLAIEAIGATPASRTCRASCSD